MNNNVFELELPKTGDVVVLKPWLTTGQSRELQKILLSKGDFSVEDPKLNKVSPETFFEMQDRGAELLIQEVRHKDGITSAFDKDWLYNLHPDDGNLIYAKVNDIINLSNLPDESKKK